MNRIENFEEQKVLTYGEIMTTREYTDDALVVRMTFAD